MHNITSEEIQHYIKSVRRLMPIYSKVEKQYLSFLQESVYDYVTENPFCTMNNITTQFGEPKDVMEQYLLTLNDEYIRDNLQKKHWIMKILIICTSLVLIVCLLFAIKYYQGHLLAEKTNIVDEEIIIEEF